MKEESVKWHSQELGQETEMLVFGHAGYPVILFPTSMGRFYQNKDFKLIDSAAWFIENGLVKIYCPDSIDVQSWYNKSCHPSERARNHIRYDKMIRNEIVPRAFAETGHGKIATAGCSFGGYHAVNFGFRYPEITGYIFSMAGAFDIKPQVDGYYDDDVYYNNPPDFIPNLSHPAAWNIGIVLGTSDGDMCLKENIRMSEILHHKEIRHWLDVRKGPHDWHVWHEMFPEYLAQIK